MNSALHEFFGHSGKWSRRESDGRLRARKRKRKRK